MELTIEHLSPYLPYELRLWHKGYKGKNILECDVPTGIYERPMSSVSMLSVLKEDSFLKPILRPISDLNLEWFQNSIDGDLENYLINCEPENKHLSIEVCDKVLGWSALSYEEYALLFRSHFDVFGLIENGLAIDINTLNDAK